jgi:hypothetical protein
MKKIHPPPPNYFNPLKRKEQAKIRSVVEGVFKQVFSTTTVIYLPESVLLVFENQNHGIFKNQ